MRLLYWSPVLLLAYSLTGCRGDKDQREDTGEDCVSDCDDPVPDEEPWVVEDSPPVQSGAWEWDAGSADDDVLLDTEEGLGDFCEGHTVVYGDLLIQGAGFSTLEALSCLVEVKGDLLISGSSLVSAELPLLSRVGGDLVTSGLYYLEDLSLVSLVEVGESLEVVDNPYLGVVYLGQVIDVGADFTARSGPEFSIKNNPNLVDVDVSGLEQATGLVEFSSNDQIERLDLSSLQSAGSIRIQDNESLLEVDLGALEEAQTEIDISDNEALATLDLETLSGWPGDLDLGANPALTLAEMSSLDSVQGDLLIQNTSFISLDLGALQSVGGEVIVENNPDLFSLNLTGMVTIGGALSILSNPVLANNIYLYLDSLVTVENLVLDGFQGGGISMWSLESLGTISLTDSGTTLYLPSLTSADEFLVTDSAYFESSLNALETVTGDIRISNLYQMSGLTLDSLTAVGGDIELYNISSQSNSFILSFQNLQDVGGNFSLLNLITMGPEYEFDEGLGALSTIGGDLSIQGTFLGSLGNDTTGAGLHDGLAGLTAVSGDVTIQSNPLLNSEDPQWLVCDVLGLDSIGGTVTITRDFEGAGNTGSVLQSCP